MPGTAKIIYTKIDEAPALATHSLLPILQAFTKGSGIELDTWDISLAGRIIANFPDRLTAAQQIPDYLNMCAELCEEPEANIIKLPNISASIPQLKGAIRELQEKGYDIPDYPDDPATDEQRQIQPAIPACWAAPSTRCCGRATPTAAPPTRSRNTASATPTG